MRITQPAIFISSLVMVHFYCNSSLDNSSSLIDENSNNNASVHIVQYELEFKQVYKLDTIKSDSTFGKFTPFGDSPVIPKGIEIASGSIFIGDPVNTSCKKIDVFTGKISRDIPFIAEIPLTRICDVIKFHNKLLLITDRPNINLISIDNYESKILNVKYFAKKILELTDTNLVLHAVNENGTQLKDLTVPIKTVILDTSFNVKYEERLVRPEYFTQKKSKGDNISFINYQATDIIKWRNKYLKIPDDLYSLAKRSSDICISEERIAFFLTSTNTLELYCLKAIK